MFQNSQTHFKNLEGVVARFFQVYLNILEHYALGHSGLGGVSATIIATGNFPD